MRSTGTSLRISGKGRMAVSRHLLRLDLGVENLTRLAGNGQKETRWRRHPSERYFLATVFCPLKGVLL